MIAALPQHRAFGEQGEGEKVRDKAEEEPKREREDEESDEVKEEKKKVNVRMCPIMTSISSSGSFLSRQFQRG